MIIPHKFRLCSLCTFVPSVPKLQERVLPWFIWAGGSSNLFSNLTWSFSSNSHWTKLLDPLVVENEIAHLKYLFHTTYFFIIYQELKHLSKELKREKLPFQAELCKRGQILLRGGNYRKTSLWPFVFVNKLWCETLRTNQDQ